MSPKNQRAQVVSKTFAAAVAAASTSSFPASVGNATSVIIGVTASVGSVVLLTVAIRIWRCTRPPKAPLPPKRPLAHDRLRLIPAQFTQSEVPASVPIRAQGFVPLPRNSPTSPYNDYTRSGAPIPPSSSSIVSSQVHLVPESDESAEIRRGRRPSLGSPSSAAQQYHNYRSRTISNTGSTRSRLSNQGTIRGPPHYRHVNIVLPQPLAPGLHNINTLRQPHPCDISGERRSESRDRELGSTGVSMDDSSSSVQEPALHLPLHHGPGTAYPHPTPPLRTEYTSPSTPKPYVSNVPLADVSSPLPPNATAPLLSLSSPSPDRGPPPPLPPKDFPPRHSSRPPKNNESAGRRPRPQ